jgi:nucleoside-diphosphate-sugar epimerase
MSFILLTGSRGLIGTALQNFLTEHHIRSKSFDIKFNPSHSNFGSILDKDSLKRAVKDCAGIIHLAGTSRVIFGEQNPATCLQNNVEGTNNVINAALSSPSKPWIIYASSREVYGQQKLLPVVEDVLLKPMNVYAHSKLAAEKKIQEAQKAGIRTSILRFSNVFGSPLDHVDRVIPAFCRAALRGHILNVDGSDNTFDFTFVDDVVRGIAKVIYIMRQNECSLPPIHFTTGRGLTLNEAAQIIVSKANSSSRMKERTPRSFDVSHFVGDPSRAKSILGWSSLFSFEEAIEKFLPLLKTYIEVEESFQESIAV